jgi:hypothetical protein
MNPVAINVYILLMLSAYVMRRVGTFSLEEKVKMIEFISLMAVNPHQSLLQESYLKYIIGQ